MDCGFFFPYILHSLLLRIYRAVSSKQKLKEKKKLQDRVSKREFRAKEEYPSLTHLLTSLQNSQC